MKAAISRDEGPDAVRIEDVPAPTPGPDEILIDVKATALNRADLLQTMGLYPAPPGAPALIPGLEYAGTVAAVGARVRRWKTGDRVMGLVPGGSWAEQLCVHEREALPIPSKLSFTDAAAIPEAFFTAYDALVLQGGMTREHQVLIHAAASGVGTAAIQLCRWLGARSIGTVRSASKLERARALGLNEGLVVGKDGFAGAVKELTGGRGCDLALELVGGDYFPETLEALTPRGTSVLVGLVAGTSAEVALRTILTKRLKIVGTTMRSRPLEEKIALAQHFEQRVLPALERGELNPVIDAVLPMSQLQAALQRLANNDSFGKLVLTW